jgi:TolB-like protein/tetratricopeptide (TPR) repeat protein
MSHVVRFGVYEADLESGELRKHGTRIRLRDQSFQVLHALLQHPGQVVRRDELRQRLWGDDIIVDFENSLNTAVAQLRQALSDSSDHPRYIETVPKRGYRFVADVSVPPMKPEAAKVRTRLAVLPFLNLTGDPAEEYFSDAVTEEVITALASLAPGQLAVIARTTAMHYKGSHKDIARIAGELRVDYVVEGGVSRTEDHVAVNVQLITTSDETHLFARKYDAEMREVFTLYGSIAHDIAEHVPALAEGMRDGTIPHPQVRRGPTEDLAAYNEYIQGRHQMWKWTPEGIAKARQHFDAALARDPDFALACDGLAELYWYLGFWGFAPSRETDRIGRFYVLRALEIDPTLAETHAVLSGYPKQVQHDREPRYFDWPVQRRDAARARRLDAASPQVRLRYALIELVLGRPDAAAAELEEALETDPLSPDLRGWLAFALCSARRYERALEEAHRVVELHPENHLAHAILGFVYMAARKYEDSATALRKAAGLSGGVAPVVLGWLGLSLGLGGRTAEARAMLDRLRAMAGERHVPPTCFAWIHLGLGDIDEAFLWMDRAIDAPDRMMSPIKTYPFLDPIRADPRFALLLRRMNLEF